MRNEKVLVLGVIAVQLVAIAAVIFLPRLGKSRMEARERERVEKIKVSLWEDIAYLNQYYSDEKHRSGRWAQNCDPIFTPLFAYEPTGHGFWTSWATMGKMLMKLQPQSEDERRCLYQGLDVLNTAWWKYGGPEGSLVAFEDRVWFYPDKKDAVVDNFYETLKKRRADILETLPGGD
jgi:hypothetical protein